MNIMEAIYNAKKSFKALERKRLAGLATQDQVNQAFALLLELQNKQCNDAMEGQRKALANLNKQFSN